jgi:hypothetical protein
VHGVVSLDEGMCDFYAMHDSGCSCKRTGFMEKIVPLVLRGAGKNNYPIMLVFLSGYGVALTGEYA